MADFKREYPWAMPSDMMPDTATHSQVYGGGWIVNSDVRVVSYWRMRSERRVLALMTDGSTQDITDASDPEEIANIAIRPDGSLFVREVDRPYAQKYICSGTDILEGPYNLPISRIPVFRVPGWEIQLGPQKFRYGMIRFLKDPQRLHNYLRSVLAEKLMQAPRAVWLAAANAVAGREKAFRDSHLSDDPLLIWNEEAGNKPERIVPPPMEVALLQQAEMTNQDIKDVSNIHEANLGMPSNEVSGVAIQARQRVSDTGTILYHDNLDSATEECGRVIDQLIPIVYDTPRIVKTLGSDAEDNMQVINVLGNPASIDITEGKYSVTVTTGPTYATKRIEQAESMLKLANAMPNVLGVAADLIVEAQDWPGADKIAARLRATLPPGILGAEDMSPEAQAAAAQKQQEQQTGLKLEMAKAVADYMATQSQTHMNTAKAQLYQVQAALAPGAAQNQSISTASEVAAREAKSHVDVLKIGT